MPVPPARPAFLRRRRTGGARLPREVYVLGLIAFCVAVGFGVLVPVLPVFARSFGVGNLEVGAVVSAFALMRLACSPFCGRLIGIFGERLVLAVGIYVVALSSGLAGISTSYEQLLVLRGIGGIGSAMFTVSATTLLLTSVGPGVRGRATGFFQAGFLLGGMAGPAIGGLLAAISITAPFFFYAATLAVAGTVGLLLLRTRSERPDDAPDLAVRPLREVLRDRRFQAACLVNLGQGWSSFGVRSALVPVLVVEVLHRSTSWTGIAFTCAAVAQTVAVGPAGRFVDSVGRRPAMVLGTVLAAVSIARRGLRTDHRRPDRRSSACTAWRRRSSGRLRPPRSAMPPGARSGTPVADVLDVVRRRARSWARSSPDTSPTGSVSPWPSPSVRPCCSSGRVASVRMPREVPRPTPVHVPTDDPGGTDEPTRVD